MANDGHIKLNFKVKIFLRVKGKKDIECKYALNQRGRKYSNGVMIVRDLSVVVGPQPRFRSRNCCSGGNVGVKFLVTVFIMTAHGRMGLCVLCKSPVHPLINLFILHSMGYSWD